MVCLETNLCVGRDARIWRFTSAQVSIHTLFISYWGDRGDPVGSKRTRDLLWESPTD